MDIHFDPAISCLTTYPKKIIASVYANYKYRHCRIVYNNKKLKIYVNQDRY